MAAPRPINPDRATTTIAHTYARFPVATTDTIIVPAIAVPNDEPRFETLRERPEISSCRDSEKLDCTMLADGVSIAPVPSAGRSSAGTDATPFEDAWE